MLTPVPDKMPEEVVSLLKTLYGVTLPDDMVRRNVPIIVDHLDKLILSPEDDRLEKWAIDATRFYPARHLYSLVRATKTAFLKAWSRRNGRAELSHLAALFMNHERRIATAIMDDDFDVSPDEGESLT